MLDQFGKAKQYPILFPLSQHILGVVIGLVVQTGYPLYWFILLSSLALFCVGCFLPVIAKTLRVLSSALFFVWLGIFLCGSKIENLCKKPFFDMTYPRRIRGVVADFPSHSKTRTTFNFRIKEILDSSDERPIGSLVKISLASEDYQIQEGDNLSFLIWLSLYKRRIFKGSFSSLTYKGILKDSIEVEKISEGSFLERILGTSREKIRSALLSSNDENAQSVIRGILLGDKKGISREVKRWFRSCGLSHILVVSGFHIGLVFGLFFFVFRCLLGRRVNLLTRVDVNFVSVLLAFWPTLFYASLTGLPYPTLRALLMLLIFICCFLVSRPVIGLNVLFLVAFLITIINPLSLLNISFQLSFAAVFGIVYGIAKVRPFYMKKLAKGRFVNHLIFKFKLYFLDLALVSVLAIVFTLPIVFYYFSKFSPIGIMTNLLFVPIFCFFVLPIGLAGMVLSIFSLPGAGLLWSMDLFLVSQVNYFICLFSKIPFSMISTKRIYFEDVVIYYFLVLMLLNWKASLSRIIAILIIVGILAIRYIF